MKAGLIHVRKTELKNNEFYTNLGEPLGESHGGDLEAMSNKAGMNGNGMSDENNSENSSGMKKKGIKR